MMTVTWDEMRRFEGRYALIDFDTDKLTLKIRAFVTQITYDDGLLKIELRNGGFIRFASPYEPEIDEDGRLFCVNDDGESIYVIPSPAQPV